MIKSPIAAYKEMRLAERDFQDFVNLPGYREVTKRGLRAWQWFIGWILVITVSLRILVEIVIRIF